MKTTVYKKQQWFKLFTDINMSMPVHGAGMLLSVLSLMPEEGADTQQMRKWAVFDCLLENRNDVTAVYLDMLPADEVQRRIIHGHAVRELEFLLQGIDKAGLEDTQKLLDCLLSG